LKTTYIIKSPQNHTLTCLGSPTPIKRPTGAELQRKAKSRRKRFLRESITGVKTVPASPVKLLLSHKII